MTTRTETWKPIPGFGSYEASDMGRVRSVDRLGADGRLRKGVVLKARVSNKGYALVNLTDDGGRKQTRTVHTLVLVTFEGPCPRDMEACHLDDDPLNNAWPGNLAWGTHPENVRQRMRNSPAAPRPVKVCVKCGREFAGNGRRCHECVVAIGKVAAVMLGDGSSLAEVCVALEYPSAEGVHTLAVKYGGYAAPPRRSWSQRVMAAVGGWFGRGDGV